MERITVGELIDRVFPAGTKYESTMLDRVKRPNISRVPWYPPDLFAVTASLLVRSGALNRLVLGLPKTDVPSSLRPSLKAMTRLATDAGIDIADEKYRRSLSISAAKWAKNLPVPAPIQKLWKLLLRSRHLPLVELVPNGHLFPSWWAYAMALMLIADEACQGVGYDWTSSSEDASWVSTWAFERYAEANEAAFAKVAAGGTGRIVSDLPSLCFLADPDVVCVQPKVRTPSVGCTLRGYTHNVALLPPRGVVSTGWQHAPGTLSNPSSALNLLVIPYPFHVSASWFRSASTQTSSEAAKWGWFGLEQKWLRSEIVAFTEALVREAQKDVGTIHGILFPEYSLDWDTYQLLTKRLMTAFQGLEFLVAGSSSNCDSEKGNFVLTSVLWDVVKNGKKTKTSEIVSSRWKHHRWRLNEAQISNYALGSALDPRLLWWEGTPLGPREIDFTVFRQSSAFTTLICEDLARSDPCHGVLRDVGANLVFAMLMDGPQLKSRWAAQYATTLADDPGSSVLTYTSLALVERANSTNKYGKTSRVIGLWKDDTGHAIEIPCPVGAHGVVLSLSDFTVSECTLDGRLDNSSRAWRFHSQNPVTLDRNINRLDKLARIVADRP